VGTCTALSAEARPVDVRVARTDKCPSGPRHLIGVGVDKWSRPYGVASWIISIRCLRDKAPPSPLTPSTADARQVTPGAACC